MVCDEDLEGVPVAEVSESDLLTALKKHAGVEAQLPDLTEFMETVHEVTKIEPRGQIGHRVLNVKANLRVYLKTHGWREKVCPGGEWVDRNGKAAARAVARGSWPTGLRMEEKKSPTAPRLPQILLRSSRQSMKEEERARRKKRYSPGTRREAFGLKTGNRS